MDAILLDVMIRSYTGSARGESFMTEEWTRTIFDLYTGAHLILFLPKSLDNS